MIKVQIRSPPTRSAVRPKTKTGKTETINRSRIGSEEKRNVNIEPKTKLDQKCGPKIGPKVIPEVGLKMALKTGPKVRPDVGTEKRTEL